MEGSGSIAHNLDEDRTDDVRLKKEMPFEKMAIATSVRKGLEQSGFVYPTIIQATAIPIGISGMDMLVQSKSGTGKTLIFATIILNAYDKKVVGIQSIVLTPTREIAVQIKDVLNKLGHYSYAFQAVAVIGGTSIEEDRKQLQRARSVIGTPGRLLHLLRNKVINVSKIKLAVIDEADQMYDAFFRKDIQDILNKLTALQQTIAFSATFRNNLDEELSRKMRNPLFISNQERATVLIGIKQFAYVIKEEKVSIVEMQSKLDVLRYIFGVIPFKQCLVFASSQFRADSYRNYLQNDGWDCELMSGAQSQEVRLENFRNFRDFKTRILITTDIMARGIDAENVNLVVNLDMPKDVVTYLHRIGRAGRFASHGLAITCISSNKEESDFRQLIREVGSGISVLNFPKKIDLNDKYDFWNFTNFKDEIASFGLFNEKNVAPIATQDKTTMSDSSEVENGHISKERETVKAVKSLNAKHVNNADNMEVASANSSIDTKTFLVNTQDSACNVLDILIEPRKLNPNDESGQSSSQQLPSSNTIDDASSIAADSVVGSELDMSVNQTLLLKKAVIPTLIEFLVDEKSTENNENEKAKTKSIDFFEAYKESILDCESKSEECSKLGKEKKIEDLKKKNSNTVKSRRQREKNKKFDDAFEFPSTSAAAKKRSKADKNVNTNQTSEPCEIDGNKKAIDKNSNMQADASASSSIDVFKDYENFKDATNNINNLHDQKIFTENCNYVAESSIANEILEDSIDAMPKLNAEKLERFKDILIDSSASTSSIKTDIYSDYANFKTKIAEKNMENNTETNSEHTTENTTETNIGTNTASTTERNIENATYTLSVETPTQDVGNIEEADYETASGSNRECLPLNKKHCNSPVLNEQNLAQHNMQAAMEIPEDEVVIPVNQEEVAEPRRVIAEEDMMIVRELLPILLHGLSSSSSADSAETSNSATSTPTSTREGSSSSGFRERSVTSSSGIATSEVALDNSNSTRMGQSDDDLVDNASYHEDYDNVSISNITPEIKTNSDDMDISNEDIETSNATNTKSTQTDDGPYDRWMNIYWNQVKFIEDYVKICNNINN